MNERIYKAMYFLDTGIKFRQCLGFLYRKEEYNSEDYTDLKLLIESLKEDGNYVKEFCENMKEFGDKFIESLDKFYDYFYNDNFIKYVDGKITTDESKIISVINLVIGIKQTFTDMCMYELANIKKEGIEIDQKYYDLINSENQYYATYATYVIAINIFLFKYPLFINSSRKEDEISQTETKQLLQELQSLIQAAAFVRGRNAESGEDFKKVISLFTECINILNGKIKPTGEQKLYDLFLPHLDGMLQTLNGIGDKYKDMYARFDNEMLIYQTENIFNKSKN